jgi:AbrB family looped-hinge helix DNA binding protein
VYKTATLSSKYQISIPKEVRQELGWVAGDKIALIPDGHGGIKLVKVPTIEALQLMFQGANPEGYRDRNDRY